MASIPRLPRQTTASGDGPLAPSFKGCIEIDVLVGGSSRGYRSVVFFTNDIGREGGHLRKGRFYPTSKIPRCCPVQNCHAHGKNPSGSQRVRAAKARRSDRSAGGRGT